MTDMINQYSGFNEELSKMMTLFGLGVCQFIVLLELMCYLSLYYWMKTDTDLESPMTQKSAQRKKHQNTITLTGQIVSFGIETVFIILFLIMMKATNWQHLQLSYMPIYADYMWCGITMTKIIASNDMRSFLLDD